MLPLQKWLRFFLAAIGDTVIWVQHWFVSRRACSLNNVSICLDHWLSVWKCHVWVLRTLWAICSVDACSMLTNVLTIRVDCTGHQCRVTNSEEEMKDPRNPLTNDPYIVKLPPEYQIPNPEAGLLERRVSKTYIEAMYTDEVNMEDTNYWFTEPEGRHLCHAYGVSTVQNMRIKAEALTESIAIQKKSTLQSLSKSYHMWFVCILWWSISMSRVFVVVLLGQWHSNVFNMVASYLMTMCKSLKWQEVRQGFICLIYYLRGFHYFIDWCLLFNWLLFTIKWTQ